MTLSEIATMLAETNLDFCYYSYPVNQAPSLPYLIYFFPGDDDFIADNSNYLDIRRLTIELYMELLDIDFTIAKSVEDILKAHNLVYTVSNDVITSDQLYRVTFESEVIFNGNQQSQVWTEPGVLQQGN